MMVVCVTVLDSVTPRQLVSTMFATPSAAFATTVVLLHTFGALINFPFNSWVSQRWFLWPHSSPRAPALAYRAARLYRAPIHSAVFTAMACSSPARAPASNACRSWSSPGTVRKWIECPFKYATSLLLGTQVRLAAPPSCRPGAHLRRVRRQWIDAGMDHHRLVQPLLLPTLLRRAPGIHRILEVILISATSSTRARFRKIAACRSWGASASTCSSRPR